MNKLTKTLLIAGSIVCLVIGTVVLRSTQTVYATQQDQCNQEFTYEKTSDFSDARVNINFSPEVANGFHTQVTTGAQSGYVVLSSHLDVEDDGHSGYFLYASGPLTNFNPNPGAKIDEAKVKVKKVCPTPTVTPSPTPTVMITPTPTQDPCDQETLLKISYDEGPYPEVDPCATPTPEVTPTPVACTGECGGSSPRPEGEKSTTEAPVCTDGTTVKLPANIHVLRHGDGATVNWFQTQGDKATIYYKEVNASDWQHSVRDIDANGRKDNFVSVEIGGLDPKLGYTFGVMQHQGCGGGQTVTAVVIDGPEPVLFNFSYWEWNK